MRVRCFRFLCILLAAAALEGPGAQAPAPAAGSETPVPPTAPLTLNELYERARAANETRRIREEELRVAEARYRQTLATFLPQIGLFARQTHLDRFTRDPERELTETVLREVNPQALRLLPRSNAVDFDFQGLNPYAGGVGLSWPLFSGFQSYRELAARDAEFDAARLAQQRFEELLYVDVANVFYQTLLYERTINLLDAEKTALEGRIAELRYRVRLGRSRDGELLTARSDLQTNRVERESAVGLLGATRELLAFLANTPEAGLRLKDEQAMPTAESLEAYLTATDERADVLAALAGLRAARSRVQVAEGGHYPSVSLDGEYYLTQKPDFGRDWQIQLRIDLPLFQGGAVAASVREAEARRRQSELTLASLRRTADYEVRSLYREFVSTSARTLLLEEAVRLARQNYAVQRRDYELGIVTNLEALTALARIQQLERSLLQAQMQAKLLALRLHIAAGRSPQ